MYFFAQQVTVAKNRLGYRTIGALAPFTKTFVHCRIYWVTYLVISWAMTPSPASSRLPIIPKYRYRSNAHKNTPLGKLFTTLSTSISLQTLKFMPHPLQPGWYQIKNASFNDYVTNEQAKESSPVELSPSDAPVSYDLFIKVHMPWELILVDRHWR